MLEATATPMPDHGPWQAVAGYMSALEAVRSAVVQP